MPQGTLLVVHFLAMLTMESHSHAKVNQNFVKSEANLTVVVKITPEYHFDVAKLVIQDLSCVNLISCFCSAAASNLWGCLAGWSEQDGKWRSYQCGQQIGID